MIIGATVLERKKCVGSLVKEHREALNQTARIVESRAKTSDQVEHFAIESAVGRIHIIASVSRDPNGSIPTSDLEGNDQSFLADKDFVVYGWTTNDGRTMLMFVPVADVRGHHFLTKNQIIASRDRGYSVVLPPRDRAMAQA